MPYVRLQTVELALDHHTLLSAVAGAVLNDHMDIDARDLTVKAGDMEFPGGLGIMLVQIRALHGLLYNEWEGLERTSEFPQAAEDDVLKIYRSPHLT